MSSSPILVKLAISECQVQLLLLSHSNERKEPPSPFCSSFLRVSYTTTVPPGEPQQAPSFSPVQLAKPPAHRSCHQTAPLIGARIHVHVENDPTPIIARRNSISPSRWLSLDLRRKVDLFLFWWFDRIGVSSFPYSSPGVRRRRGNQSCGESLIFPEGKRRGRHSRGSL